MRGDLFTAQIFGCFKFLLSSFTFFHCASISVSAADSNAPVGLLAIDSAYSTFSMSVSYFPSYFEAIPHP